MTPYSTTSTYLPTRQSTVAYSGYISFSVPLSFCLGTVRHRLPRGVWPALTNATHSVMIIAEPYFLSQLQRSSIRSTFSSYLATTFTLSNFAFLAHATLTSKKVTSLVLLRLSPQRFFGCSSSGRIGRL
jgi:hypothetical protein